MSNGVVSLYSLAQEDSIDSWTWQLNTFQNCRLHIWLVSMLKHRFTHDYNIIVLFRYWISLFADDIQSRLIFNWNLQILSSPIDLRHL